ncbi:Rho -interacting cell polarization regulator 1 [Saguinus oedipus]|uniref:Rho -interacting cell polarization regulator 1 n=1 Tax=Saguinus oedipus TaxID=9490 RepID=A0ABQ9WDC5_SAGOE|nr:Rho -interacting cell polarization regulator 1 [Saguinus oedipus]
MKYGRQHWKLRGRIEGSGKQVWDSEETIFLPLLTEFLSIKVTELKGLANHVVVGSVSCETKDLFAALPQVVDVDINDLGTIKLSLEVTWSPFDKDDQPSAASSVNKACASPPIARAHQTHPGFGNRPSITCCDGRRSWRMGQHGLCLPNLQVTHPAHSSQALPATHQPLGPWCSSPSPFPSKLPSAYLRPLALGSWMRRGLWPQSWQMRTYSTLSHISEANVDAALAEASVEAVGPESPAQGPSPPIHPDTTHGEYPNPDPPALDPGHSATSSTPGTTGSVPTSTDPAPSAHLDLVHKATDSGPSEPGPTHTTTGSTYSDITSTHSAPSTRTHTTPGSTHKPIISTLTATGPTLNITGSVQTTTSPAHSTASPTHTSTSPTHTFTSPTHATSPTHKTTSPTHTTISPTHKARKSTHTTTSCTPSAIGQVQTATSPSHPTTSPTPTNVSPSTSLELATLPSPSVHSDRTLPGTDSFPCRLPASSSCTQADPIAPSTSHPSPAHSSWKPLTSPAPDPPEPMVQSPSPTPSPPTPAPQHSELSVAMVVQTPVPGAAGGTGNRRLEEALGALMAALDDYHGQFPELQGLDQEVTRLESLLMQRQGLTRSRASSLSITVEHALESFGFLNEDEDEDNDVPGDRPPSSPEAGAEDSKDSPSAHPLSMGCPALDAALVQHLYHCSLLLLKLGTFGPLCCQEAWALEWLLWEAQVLEAICEFSSGWETLLPGKWCSSQPLGLAS